MIKQRQSILLVDDDSSDLEFASRMLGDMNYDVTAVLYPDEAERYKGKRFSLAVIDGLQGDCFKVYDEVDAERRVIHTADGMIIKEAKDKGIEAVLKNILSWDKIL